MAEFPANFGSFETYDQARARVAAQKPNVIDIRTRGPFYAPGSLGATLKAIDDAFQPMPSNG
jgi:hypothetical protein